jgi:hypothetical protein
MQFLRSARITAPAIRWYFWPQCPVSLVVTRERFKVALPRMVRVMAYRLSSVVVRILPSANRGKEMIDDEVCYLAAQDLSGGQVSAEMHAGENST